MTLIISSDEIKKTLDGYTPDRSEEFHIQSAKIADKAFKSALKLYIYSKVILLSGGAASGKSEYVSEYLQDSNAIIMDGTLPNIVGAHIKIDNSIKRDKQVEIHAIIPKSLKLAFLVFLSRDRKFSQVHFYGTHAQSRATLLKIIQEYPNVIIKLIHSEYKELKEGGAMEFTEIVFADRQHLIEFVTDIQYTEAKIRNEISNDI